MKKQLELLRLNLERKCRKHQAAMADASAAERRAFHRGYVSATRSARIQVQHILNAGTFGVSILRASERTRKR
jgi:hypothetical protein